MLDTAAVAIDRRSAQAYPFTPQGGRPGTQSKLGKHRSVYLAGDDADRMFEVESGAVMLYRILDDGRRQVVEVVFPGGICGLTSSNTYASCCETLLPSVLRSFKKSEIERSDALRARIVERLQSQISRMHDHTVSLGRKTAEERVCTLILRLQEVEHADVKPDCSVALPMTRTEIADYLGLTLETVCRTLTSLARRKVVEAGRTKSELRVPCVTRLRQAASCDA